MKLRNKKTGEIVNVESLGHADSLKENYGYQVTLSWKTEYDNLSQCKDYNSLAELNADWEDVKEPLIKDEKIRKVVRDWAEANGVKEIIVFDHINNAPYTPVGAVDFAQNSGHLEIRFRTEERFDTDRIYTIAELCGEEKECEN